MFNWRWKRVLGNAWGLAIDIAVVFLGVGGGFFLWAKLSNLLFRHLIDTSANNVIQVASSYCYWVNGYVIGCSVIVIVVALVFIGISRLIVYWMSQR
jgi:hypothetical protein